MRFLRLFITTSPKKKTSRKIKTIRIQHLQSRGLIAFWLHVTASQVKRKSLFLPIFQTRSPIGACTSLKVTQTPRGQTVSLQDTPSPFSAHNMNTNFSDAKVSGRVEKWHLFEFDWRQKSPQRLMHARIT